MPFDNHKNFAYSTVAAAPDPADTGSSLTVETGHGSRFPAAPFNATVWPAGDEPTVDNGEILRVTAVAGGVLTIARAQEGTSARSVVVGDQIAATITVKTLTDVEVLIWRTRGLRIENDWTTPNSKVRVVADEITIEDVLASAVSVTADIAVSGANGLDTGLEAANTWYAIWLIHNPSTATVASLLSTSFTNPMMPSGYTKKRRVGAVRNDASSNFYRLFQVGDKVLFQNIVVGAAPEHRLLNAGTATAFTTVNASFIAPPTSRRIVVQAYIAGTPGNGRVRITGSGVATGRQIVNTSQANIVTEYTEIDLNSSQQFDYLVNASSVQLTIVSHGYYDQVL